jgi:hypothetical protein
VLVLVPVTAACGSKKTNSSTTTTAAPTTTEVPTTLAPTTTAPLSPQEAAVRAKLQPLMLQASDLGAGWTAQPGSGNATSKATADGLESQLDSCLGIADLSKHDQGRAMSDLFTNGQGVTAVSTGEAYASSSDVATFARALSSAKATGCLESTFKATVQAAQQGITVSAVNLTTQSGAAAGRSNQLLSIDGTVTVMLGQNSATLNVSAAEFRAGTRETVLVTFFGIGAPVPAATRDHAFASVATRSAHAS